MPKLANVKATNPECLTDVSRLIINKHFGALGLSFKVSGGNIIDLEVFEVENYGQKPAPLALTKPSSDLEGNISTMLRFLAKIELLVKEIGFGSLFIRLTVKNDLPYRFTVMTSRKRKYTSKSKKAK